MLTKETLMLLGVVATLIVGIWNLVIGTKNRYINNINAERIKWVNSIREAFANFNKRIFVYANFLDRVNDGEEEDENKSIFPEIMYYNNLIELYLNPIEILTKKLIVLQNELIDDLSTGSIDMKKCKKDLSIIRYYQQVILKAEWKRMKKEASKGREINDYTLSEIFIKTAIDVDKSKYEEYLKTDFEKNT